MAHSSNERSDLSQLEEALQYTFTQKSLLEEALTHGSAKLIDASYTLSNQRLEFLGDAILGAVIADWVFEIYPTVDEGQLTKFRTIIINSNSLYQIGSRLGLASFAIVHPREIESGLLELPATIEDFVEAIIGAVYLDGGWENAKTCIQHLVGKIEPLISQGLVEFNPKGQLQEWAQANDDGQTIDYQTISATGPDHNRNFTVEVLINGEAIASGTGSSKKSAQTAAALKALQILKK